MSENIHKSNSSLIQSSLINFSLISAIIMIWNILWNGIFGWGFYFSLNLINPLSFIWKIITLFGIWNQPLFFVTHNIFIGIVINYLIAFFLSQKNISLNIDMDSSESNLLTIRNIMINTISIAKANFLSIILISLIWILTIWIPYINVGTTLAMWGFCITIAKNEKFDVSDLFASKYRKYIGEFFLLTAFLFFGSTIGKSPISLALILFSKIFPSFPRSAFA